MCSSACPQVSRTGVVWFLFEMLGDELSSFSVDSGDLRAHEVVSAWYLISGVEMLKQLAKSILFYCVDGDVVHAQKLGYCPIQLLCLI